MSEAPPARENDTLRRFLFEAQPLRGHWLRLQDSWAQALEHQHYGPELRRLLGEAMAAAALLAASLKFQGTLTLQIGSGQGPLQMLVAQSTHELGVRALARVAEGVDLTGFGFRELVSGAQLTVTVATGTQANSWQGVVSLDGDCLAECIESYFETSEQLPTRVMLAADAHRVAGLLLQKLPSPAKSGEAAEGRVQELWDEAGLLMRTVGQRELLDEAPESLLPRLFGGHELRLFASQPVQFRCGCSAERVAGMLRSLGEDEVRSIIAEQGAVTVTCEFCQRPRRYDAVDALALFRPGGGPEPGPNSILN